VVLPPIPTTRTRRDSKSKENLLVTGALKPPVV